MHISIPDAIQQLLEVVAQLHKAYPQKPFTLDGRLVGDIGEVLVEGAYDVKLFEGLQAHHDAEARDGRLVQIKATMKESLTFPADYVPDYYLGIKIHADGHFDEVFNGPGKVAWDAVSGRKRPPGPLHSVSLKKLSGLSATVSAKDRIPRRRIAKMDRSQRLKRPRCPSNNN